MIVAYALIAMARTEDVDHEFVFRANEKLQHVSLAGSFNGWNKDADPMALSPDGVTWKKRLRLKPGAYTYKFVLNGDRWIVDPKAKRNVDDGNGNTNSQVVIAPTTFAKSAVKGDGAITVSALKALTDPPYLNVDRGKLSLWLRTRSNDVAQVSVQVKGVGSIPMADVEGDDLFERYSAKVGWDRKHDLRYRFVLDDGRGSMVFGPAGLTPLTDRRCAGFGNSYIVRASTFHPFVVPNWVEHSIIYQIFPDRFANGDKANDPPNVQAWDSRPSYNSYLGGDIAGIEGRLPYLKWLGVSTIYFNPVFQSPSYHRYETADYFKIDPIFGTNEEFIKLVGDLKRLGIRTVLDGVFNHTATTFPAFADVVKNGKGSKFTDWYTFKSFPVRITRNPNYLAWSNFASMPKLNYGNPDVRKYVLSVPDYWQSKAGIAGWRLDAGDEVAHDFWRAFRSKVKSLDKNAWILGEVWGDGSSWLKGDQWDSVMNYPFRQAVLSFVTKEGTRKPSDLMRGLMHVYNGYAPQVSRNLMNLIDSHDTPRILTICGGDRSLAKLAAILQFTWVGVPNIYYGDELGMAGGRDPDNRRGVPWSTASKSNETLMFYRTLIRVRNENLPLQSGDPLPILTDDKKGLVVFGRVLDQTADLVAINRSDEEQSLDLNLKTVAGLPKSAITVEFTDALTGRTYPAAKSTLHLRLTPRSAAVLIPRLGSSIHSRHARNANHRATLAMSFASASKEHQ